MRLTEKAFMQQVRELARLFGWLEFHPYDSRRSTPGYPDLFMVRPPSVLFVELKADAGRVTTAQQTWLEALKQCPGVEVYLWRPGDWETIVKRLAQRSGNARE